MLYWVFVLYIPVRTGDIISCWEMCRCCSHCGYNHASWWYICSNKDTDYLRAFPRKWEIRRNNPSTPDGRGLSFSLISTFTWRCLKYFPFFAWCFNGESGVVCRQVLKLCLRGLSTRAGRCVIRTGTNYDYRVHSWALDNSCGTSAPVSEALLRHHLRTARPR